MQTIVANMEREILVSDEDYEWLSQWEWKTSKCHGRYLVFRYEKNLPNHYPKKKKILLKREIAGRFAEIDNKVIVYANDNGLDNRRENLLVLPSLMGFERKDWNVIISWEAYKRSIDHG